MRPCMAYFDKGTGMQERIRELCAAINAVVDAADFDVTHYAKEFGYRVGDIISAPEQTSEQLLRYAPTRIHDGLLGFLDMSQKLHDMGLMYGGHGYFSSVFQHDATPGVVYKLSMRTDDAYAAFALWARANPNPHAPVFHDIQRGRRAVVFAIKEYLPLGVAQSRGELPPAFSAYDLMYRVYANRPNTLYRHNLVKYLREIRKFFRGVAQVDVHGENLMFDPDSKRIIVTDPVSFTKSQEDYQCYSTT